MHTYTTQSRNLFHGPGKLVGFFANRHALLYVKAMQCRSVYHTSQQYHQIISSCNHPPSNFCWYFSSACKFTHELEVNNNFVVKANF